MKHHLTSLVVLLLACFLLLLGCSSDDPVAPVDVNHAPVITSINISNTRPGVGSLVEVRVGAYDSDGDELSYEWTVSGGEVLPTEFDSKVNWVLPQEGSWVNISVRVSDSDKAVSDNRTITMQDVASFSGILDGADNATAISITPRSTDRFTLSVRSLVDPTQVSEWTYSQDGGISGPTVFEEGRPITPLSFIRPGAGDYWIVGSILTEEFGDDFYLAYTTRDKSILWEYSWGGSGSQDAHRVTLDEEYSAYVLGNSQSAGGSHRHPVVTKIDRWGVERWRTQLTAGSDEGWGSDGGLVTLSEGRCLVGYTRMYRGRSAAVYAVLDSLGAVESRVMQDSYASGLVLLDLIPFQGIYYGIGLDLHEEGGGFIRINEIDPGEGFLRNHLESVPAGIVLTRVILTQDQNLALVGCKVEEENGDRIQAILMKVTLEGDILWTHRFGGLNDAVFHDVTQLSDGTFACVGELTNENGETHPWVVKTNQYGYLDE